MTCWLSKVSPVIPEKSDRVFIPPYHVIYRFQLSLNSKQSLLLFIAKYPLISDKSDKYVFTTVSWISIDTAHTHAYSPWYPFQHILSRKQKRDDPPEGEWVRPGLADAAVRELTPASHFSFELWRHLSLRYFYLFFQWVWEVIEESFGKTRRRGKFKSQRLPNILLWRRSPSHFLPSSLFIDSVRSYRSIIWRKKLGRCAGWVISFVVSKFGPNFLLPNQKSW